jgi:hypothetical protein
VFRAVARLSSRMRAPLLLSDVYVGHMGPPHPQRAERTGFADPQSSKRAADVTVSSPAPGELSVSDNCVRLAVLSVYEISAIWGSFLDHLTCLQALCMVRKHKPPRPWWMSTIRVVSLPNGHGSPRKLAARSTGSMVSVLSCLEGYLGTSLGAQC